MPTLDDILHWVPEKETRYHTPSYQRLMSHSGEFFPLQGDAVYLPTELNRLHVHICLELTYMLLREKPTLHNMTVS